VHDFAQVYLDGVFAGTLDRHYNQTTISLTTTKPAQLDILVENTGRLNSTKWMRHEWKGIQSATLAGRPLTGWEIYSLPMSKTPQATSSADSRNIARPGPHIAAGSFHLDETGDTFLDVRSLGKGLLWINDRCLGRFWNIGPQYTLYLPAPWLKRGRNEVVVFDLFPASSPLKLAGLEQPILNGPTPAYAADPEHQKKPDPNAEFAPAVPAANSSPHPKE
jgi:beta-galactosidase